MQRPWLTATKLGLQLQPEMTPLIFGRYARQTMAFSQAEGALSQAKELLSQLEALLGKDQASYAKFMGRIGASHTRLARSVRMPGKRLVLKR